jgi:hypothetical protein
VIRPLLAAVSPNKSVICAATHQHHVSVVAGDREAFGL